MNYRIAQNPDLPSLNELKPPASSVNPIETFGNQSKPTAETTTDFSKLSGLTFPASYPKVAASLTKLGLKVNNCTLRGRWSEKYIEPALEGVNCPLWKENGVTEFGFNAISEILQRCVFAGSENIAPETLREALIERYGVEPVKESLSVATDLLQRSKQQKEQAETDRESSALARIENKAEAQLLIEALELRRLAKSVKPCEKKGVLSSEEMIKIFAEELAREDAIEDFRKQVREGRVTIEDIL